MGHSAPPSTGDLLSARAALEVAADRAVLAAVREFRTAGYAAVDTLTAAPTTLLRTALEAVWEAATLRVVAAAGRILSVDAPPGLGDPSPTPLALRAPGALGVAATVMTRSQIPAAGFTAVTTVLSAASMGQWSGTATRSALNLAFRPTAQVPVLRVDPADPAPAPGLEGFGVTWRERSAQLARSAATATVAAHALEQYGLSPYAVGARWLSMHDSRVRASHSAAHGQTQPLGAPFTVGGAELRYPGDPNGPIDQVAGCRCILGPVYD